MTDQEAVIRAAEKLGYAIHSDYEFGPLVHYWVNDPHDGDIYYNHKSKMLHRLLALEILERQDGSIRFYAGTDGQWKRANAIFFTGRTNEHYVEVAPQDKPDIYMAIIRKYAEVT